MLDLAAAALVQFERKPTEPPTIPGARGRDWLLHFLDREPMEVIFSDGLTHVEVLALYPAAVAATPWQEATAAPQSESQPAPHDPFPKLPSCRQCGNLTNSRRCLAAARGELAGTARRYEPMADAGKRCEGFAPLPSDPDQRTARERWPWLINEKSDTTRNAKPSAGYGAI